MKSSLCPLVIARSHANHLGGKMVNQEPCLSDSKAEGDYLPSVFVLELPEGLLLTEAE